MTMTQKEQWKADCMAAYESGNFERLVYLLAANVGDNGNIETWIDNLVSETDSTIYC